MEARVDPAFQELSEQESSRLYQRAFRTWLERRLAEPSPGLRRASPASHGAIPGTILRPSNNCSTPAENWWSGAITPPLGVASRLLAMKKSDTVLRMARELAELCSRPRRVTDNLYIGLQPVRLMVQGAEGRTARSGFA